MAQPPDFALLLTDGDSNHVPSAEEIQQGYQTAEDYGLTQKALSNFANEMMRKADRKAEKGLTYTKMPDGYSVWPCQRSSWHQRGKNPKMDWYIFGHPSRHKFDSFVQFATHIHFIQQPSQTNNCPCKVCRKYPVPVEHLPRPDPVPATLITPSAAPPAAAPATPITTPVAHAAPEIEGVAAESGPVRDGEYTLLEEDDDEDNPQPENDDGVDAPAEYDDGEDTRPRMDADHDEERRRLVLALLCVLFLLLAVMVRMVTVGFSGF